MKAPKNDVDLAESERQQLEYWKDHAVFESIQNTRKSSGKTYAFYDGPPFANGLPHYGHILANTLKDTVPRYWTMRGYYVERRFGWDCHGLPVEYEIEKRDKLKGRSDILKMGVARFNEECRASVLHYAKEWEKTITRLGRWVSWDNQYRTMDKNFMESVWWVFGELYNKGLVYKDYKVVPYSPRITAVLSNFEANQNYKDTQDPAITVKFKSAEDDNIFYLAWTTTPWTLISNLALCVGPEIDYVKILDKTANQYFIVAESRLAAIYKIKDLNSDAAKNSFEIVERLKGSQLAGRSYLPLFSYFKNTPNAFKILCDDYVSTDDGSGIVHMAPAYGEDDFRVCKAHSISLVDPIDEEARFKSEIVEHAGTYVKDADKDIIRRLKESGHLFKQDTIVHSYPFCERTDHPLIYRAIPAWYVSVEKIKDVMIRNNQTINWVPQHLRDGRMGKWLENARDWAISRNRFWGTPIPVWICNKNEDHRHVIGSAKALEDKVGKKIDDLHKHFIDDLSFKCAQCDGTMHRIQDVFDCWFESGSMPYAQQHYPFANHDRFGETFPADFIAEGLDQTRGWFYTLSVLSAALFAKPAFKNVVVNGIILDENGRKMSKRHRNYTPPDELLDKYGADSVRLYMLNSSILRGEDLIFSDKGVKDTTRQVILPLWNSYSFLATYAAADGWKASSRLANGGVPKLNDEMDRWLVSRLQSLTAKVHIEMEHYRLYAVVPEILSFIEDLTNWYIRLSRRRFWGQAGAQSDDDDTSIGHAPLEAKPTQTLEQNQIEAYETLYFVLISFLKIFAPFAPFIAERIYREMTEGMNDVPLSVHCCEIPQVQPELVDLELEKRMNLIRTVTELGRSLRAKIQIKTRQALSNVLVITRNPQDRKFIDDGRSIILNELNIKTIDFSTDEQKYVQLNLKPNLKSLGKRLGKDLNTLRIELERISQNPSELSQLMNDLETKSRTVILSHELTPDDFLIDRKPIDERPLATSSGVTILLDTKITPELKLEGFARELVNRVQKLRKESQLVVSDRIDLNVAATEPSLRQAFETHKDYIAQETLAKNIHIVADTNKAVGSFIISEVIAEYPLSIAISKIS